MWYTVQATWKLGLFFMPKNGGGYTEEAGFKTMQMKTLEVEVVRVRITLACTECKQRNYNMTKEKKNHPERMETKKYCKFCQRHTMHKETK